MRIFTLDEANSLLTLVEPKLTAIHDLYGVLAGLKTHAAAAARASQHGGGMQGGTRYVQALYEIGKITTEIGELGIEVKDLARGLIDFPSYRGDRLVYLCWELGEGPRIQWWHEIEAGFAGRQPI